MTVELTDKQQEALNWHLKKHFPDTNEQNQARQEILSADNAEQKLFRIVSMHENHLKSESLSDKYNMSSKSAWGEAL